MNADLNTYTRYEVETLCDRALVWGIIYGTGLSLGLVFVARFLFGVH